MSGFLRSLRRRRNENLSRRQLERMDARTLADIGLVRGDIAALVRKLH